MMRMLDPQRLLAVFILANAWLLWFLAVHFPASWVSWLDMCYAILFTYTGVRLWRSKQ